MTKINLERARKQYPSTDMTKAHWLAYLQTPAGLNTLGQIYHNIIDQTLLRQERERGETKVGRRPTRKAIPIQEVHRIIITEQYTTKPFHEALADLWPTGMKQTAFAHRTGLSQPNISTIRNGHRTPTQQEIEAIASALTIPPWYFVEWRTRTILETMERQLTTDPTSSITIMKKLQETAK